MERGERRRAKLHLMFRRGDMVLALAEAGNEAPAWSSLSGKQCEGLSYTGTKEQRFTLSPSELRKRERRLKAVNKV